MAQTWLTTVLASVAADGSGNTTSTGVGSVTIAPQQWPVTLTDGMLVPVTGSGDTTSTGVGAATTVLLDWYTIAADVSFGGYGNTTSQGVGSVSVVNPTVVGGAGSGNTQSAGGNIPLPGSSYTRPFFAPLDVAPVTAPLDVAPVTAPLDLTYTEA